MTLTDWHMFCVDLIHGAAQGPIPYAREVLARSRRWHSDPDLAAWFASRPDAEAVDALMATWSTWGGWRRTLGHALLNGEASTPG